jgi:hypothetical protein
LKIRITLTAVHEEEKLCRRQGGYPNLDRLYLSIMNFRSLGSGSRNIVDALMLMTL